MELPEVAVGVRSQLVTIMIPGRSFGTRRHPGDRGGVLGLDAVLKSPSEPPDVDAGVWSRLVRIMHLCGVSGLDAILTNPSEVPCGLKTPLDFGSVWVLGLVVY